MAEALAANQVLGVGHDGGMADHHALRAPGGARRVQDVGCAFGHAVGTELGRQALVGIVGQALLQRHRHAAATVQREVRYQEVYVGMGTQTYDLALLQAAVVGHPALHPRQQVGIGAVFVAADHRRLVRIQAGVLLKIVL